MPIRIAINGFGRIGRAAFKIAFGRKEYEIVAINDLVDPKTLAYLLSYDSVYGPYDRKVRAKKDSLIIDGHEIAVTAIREPEKLPWKKMKVDVVIESTGRFTKSSEAKAHLTAGAKRVIISAPTKDNTQTLVLGTKLTDQLLKKGDPIVSNASCTTNCIAPVIQVLQSRFGIEKAMMTTVHAYTASQALVDAPNKDLREGRAAAQNIIPTSTGAAKATALVIPELKDNFDGIAMRVPVMAGSISDITCVLKRKRVTVKQINDEFKKAERFPLYKGILKTTTDPIVSTDIIGTSYSAIVDLSFTRVVGGNLVKVLAWYDNEWGYANRLVELVRESR